MKVGGSKYSNSCKELKTQGPKAFRVIKAQPVEKEGLTGTAAM